MVYGTHEFPHLEERLDSDLDWALREGSTHFENSSAVHETLQRIAQRLDEIGVDDAIADGMAMFFHGYRRFTEDVDILVTRESLQTIHGKREGLGYLPVFAGSKNLRDTISGVRIEFLITGDYPGDSQPKPVAFPGPREVAISMEGVQSLAVLPKRVLCIRHRRWSVSTSGSNCRRVPSWEPIDSCTTENGRIPREYVSQIRGSMTPVTVDWVQPNLSPDDVGFGVDRSVSSATATNQWFNGSVLPLVR